jgi:outer membrane protein assembly factor BamB
MNYRLFITAVLLLNVAGFSLSLAEDQPVSPDWTQWRGPERTGHAPGPAFPASLDGLERKWHVKLGKGYPGPIVSGDRVFVVETVDKKTVAVQALDRTSGKQLWRQSWPATGRVPFFAARNGNWVRSTPAYDGKTLFVGDMEEVLVALDGATGEVRWKVDLPARFETDVPDFGFASSPLVWGDHLFVQGANSIVKLDKKNGGTVWRALESRGEIAASGAFSSPMPAEIGGRQLLLVQTRHTLNGLDPDSGEVRWSENVPNFRGMNILTPATHENAVFTSTYRNESFLFEITETERGTKVELRWKNPAKGYMSSPVVIDGHVYLHLGNGRLTCIDLANGERRWTSEPMGKYWSLVYRDDKILGLGENGTLYLVRASPESFELLASREISDEETWGHLAVSGREIFVRELEGISAWAWQEKRGRVQNGGFGDTYRSLAKGKADPEPGGLAHVPFD